MRGMDALLTETEPVRTSSTARNDLQRWIRIAFFATLGVGVLWRCVRYFGQFPIWGDEAMLLLNILERDFIGLTQPLRYAQVAPVLFLWLEKTALLVFGPGEWSVHLFPWLAGLIALGVYWHACNKFFSPTVAGLAIGVLAVAYYPVRHACEVKPYAFDLCFAVIYLWLTLEYLRTRNPLTPSPSPLEYRGRGENVWLIALVGVTPVAVFVSYPSVFVGGAMSLVLLLTMRSATLRQRGWYVLFNVALLASFVLHHGVIGRQEIDAEQAQRAREFLHNYWKDAFPPESVLAWPWWLLKVFTGNMMAYPMGAHNGGSTLTFLLVLLGTYKLWRDARFSLLALCWLPFALNIVAAILHKYPFGDSARITLHLAPFTCILMAHGLSQMLDWIRAPEWRTRLHLAVFALLLGFGVIGVVRDVLKPFKTEHDRDVRQLARDIRAQVAPGEFVLLSHERDEELLAEFLWNIRAEGVPLRRPSDGVDGDAKSHWILQCSNAEPGEVTPLTGWTTAASEVRFVPPENRVMPPMYCRWTRMIR